MEASEINEQKMNRQVSILINYMYEEAFCVNTDIIVDSRYEELFKEIYCLFVSKGLSNKYYEIMKLYVLRCLVKSDYLNLDVLLDNLGCLKSKTKIKQKELMHIKSKFSEPQKRLKLN